MLQCNAIQQPVLTGTLASSSAASALFLLSSGGGIRDTEIKTPSAGSLALSKGSFFNLGGLGRNLAMFRLLTGISDGQTSAVAVFTIASSLLSPSLPSFKLTKTCDRTAAAQSVTHGLVTQ